MMNIEEMSKNDIEYLISKYRQAKPPTLGNLNKLGLTWEYLAECFECDERTLRRNRNDVWPESPVEGKSCEEWVNEILDHHEKIIDKYIGSYKGGTTSDKAKRILKAWKDEKPWYKIKLEQYYMVRSMSRVDTKKNMDEFNEKQKMKIGKLLKKIKPTFDTMSKDSAKKIAHYYRYYSELFNDRLMASVSVLTPSARRALLEEIDRMNISDPTIKGIREKGLYCGRLWAGFSGIISFDGSKIRGGMKTAWEEFEKNAYETGYSIALEMTAEILLFSIQDIDYVDLAIYITYRTCLNSDQCYTVQQIANRLARQELNRQEMPNPDLVKWLKTLEEEPNSQRALEKVFGLE